KSLTVYFAGTTSKLTATRRQVNFGTSVRFKKTVRKLAPDELFEHAVRYLALQACSSDQLRLKLRPRAASEADLESAVARLKDVGYLNDERFAEHYASNRVENDGFGRMRVLQDLRARRVSGGLAEKAVEHAFEGKNEAELIDAYIDRRMPAIAAGGKIEDDRKLAAAYRRLRRAGFSSGGVLSALKRRAANPELLEEPPPDEEPDPLAEPGDSAE
ncbi:MAG: recombination regulator RecX, partial [Acidobacteriota bacterium]|nr:recombination regulator RecX [Acidobacteriota bacterium]